MIRANLGATPRGLTGSNHSRSMSMRIWSQTRIVAARLGDWVVISAVSTSVLGVGFLVYLFDRLGRASQH
jgi:hypothetical protein